ncbi:uncharacterized protein [Bemisia tabaci]
MTGSLDICSSKGDRGIWSRGGGGLPRRSIDKPPIGCVPTSSARSVHHTAPHRPKMRVLSVLVSSFACLLVVHAEHEGGNKTKRSHYGDLGGEGLDFGHGHETIKETVHVETVPIPVDRPYPVHVPVPYPVEKHVPVPYTVEKHLPVPIKVPIPHLTVVRYVKKHVHVPYPVYIKKHVHVPYPVEKLVHVPVKVPVHVPYPVEKPVPYPVEVPVKEPYAVSVPVEKPVYVPVKTHEHEQEHGYGDLAHYESSHNYDSNGWSAVGGHGW